MDNREQRTGNREQPACERGFMLLGLIVAIALILLVLGVAAPRVAHSLRRDRELEAVHRGNQYVRAIQLYYRKFGHYPGSLEQLENTNKVRYLRQRYVDPLTGKADFRLIPPGQNKTTVKGFFGEPLAGIASAGLGAAAGMQSAGMGGAAAATGAGGAAGATAATGAAGASSAPGSPGSAGTSGTPGAPGATNSTDASGTFGSAGGFGSQSATGFSGSTGPFMGVGSSASGGSIIELNEQTTYETWEFLYDPRIEKLKAAAALNAGPGSVGAGTLGQTPGAFGSTPATPTTPTGAPGGTAPTGATPPPQP